MARDKEKVVPTGPLYIALEDFDLSFYQTEVDAVVAGWKDGLPVTVIAENVAREVEEVFVLLFDMANRGKIKNRPNGLFGAVKS